MSTRPAYQPSLLPICALMAAESIAAHCSLSAAARTVFDVCMVVVLLALIAAFVRRLTRGEG